MKRIGKYPRLLDQKSGALKSVQDFLIGEMETEQISADLAKREAPVFAALILLIDMELRFRNPRRKPVALMKGNS